MCPLHSTGAREASDGAVLIKAHKAPTPYTLHPTLFTSHPTPFPRHASRFTPHPTPFTLHPSPCGGMRTREAPDGAVLIGEREARQHHRPSRRPAPAPQSSGVSISLLSFRGHESPYVGPMFLGIDMRTSFKRRTPTPHLGLETETPTPFLSFTNAEALPLPRDRNTDTAARQHPRQKHQRPTSPAPRSETPTPHLCLER